MNLVQTALVVIGALALIEAVWGLTAPRSIKQIVGWFLKVSRPTHVVMGALFLLVALVLFVLVLIDQPLSAWIVLLIGLLFAGLALLCFRPDALQRMLRIWILNRTVIFVRVVYAVELIVAITLITVALMHK